MASFLLVHGAWHGAWCWTRVLPLLEAQGHRVLAIDLPGHGDDPTPHAEVTLDGYAARVCDAVKELPGQVHLVGHSMGGLVISEAAERCPEGIAQLVYLAAFLPIDGESLGDLAGSDRIQEAVLPSEAALTLDLTRVRDLFYHDCSREDLALAHERLGPQPLAPLSSPVELSESRFGDLPRHYLECTQDHTIEIDVQRDLHRRTPCEVRTLECSHSPFFAMPEALAEQLDQIARGASERS